MKRVYKWLAWIVGVPIVGFVLLVGVAFWMVKRDEGKFATLPPGERQLAIFDAFASEVELHYYDREFIEREWPPLRDKWRAEAEKSRTDFDVYWKVMFQLSQKVPSSHIEALPPPSMAVAARENQPARAPPGDSGFEFALIRRGKRVFPVVGFVTSGSPAALAGIEPGWVVDAFKSCEEGERVSAKFFTSGTPEERLSVESGRTVTLDEKSIKSVDYTCVAFSERPPFETRLIDGISYIRFDTFKNPAIIDQVLAELDRAGERGVIIDLRTNSGGLRDEMVRLMSRLMPDGLLVATEITPGARTEFRARGGSGFAPSLVLLIGPGTASAGEVTAAALQDHRRARLIGRPTAGATLLSGEFPLPDGGRAMIAFADLLRPNSERIEAAGVMPDINVMPNIDEIRAGRDPALERALAELATTVASSPPGNQRRAE